MKIEFTDHPSSVSVEFEGDDIHEAQISGSVSAKTRGHKTALQALARLFRKAAARMDEKIEDMEDPL